VIEKYDFKLKNNKENDIQTIDFIKIRYNDLDINNIYHFYDEIINEIDYQRLFYMDLISDRKYIFMAQMIDNSEIYNKFFYL
jgi:hypothetical protein